MVFERRINLVYLDAISMKLETETFDDDLKGRNGRLLSFELTDLYVSR